MEKDLFLDEVRDEGRRSRRRRCRTGRTGRWGRVVRKRVGGEVSRRVAHTGGVENGHRLPTATPGSAADETRENDGGAELDVVEAIQHS